MTLRTGHFDEPHRMIPFDNNNNSSSTTMNTTMNTAVASAKVIITSMVTVKHCQVNSCASNSTNNNLIVCGFSDGTINLWISQG
jgi:hypothetical protein